MPRQNVLFIEPAPVSAESAIPIVRGVFFAAYEYAAISSDAFDASGASTNAT